MKKLKRMAAMVDKKSETGLHCLEHAQDLEAEVVYYEPIPEWVTGMGIVQFRQAVKLKNPESATATRDKRLRKV